jgi:demethylmenaquinone methyltransferase/2-methoxy-6-polyprenyl-1,4-benzoquinol methylase
MSSLALMRWLESAPERYDAGMRLITLGRVLALHQAVAEAAAAEPRARVLEIGCGTGAVTARLVERGAEVTALDQNPEMMDRARERLERLEAAPGSVTWLERTASEIDALAPGAFDAVVISLALSEMSAAERRYVLREAARRLVRGGVLAVADEVRPARGWQRVLFALLRGPQALLGWLLAGSVSRPVPDLASEVRGAGFGVRAERRWLLGSLALVAAEPAPGMTEEDPS